MSFSSRYESILIRLLGSILVLCAVHHARADAYDAMRIDWFNNLAGGTSYDSTDSDVATATTSLTGNANAYWTILKATKPFKTTPFSDIAIGSDSDNITNVYGRLETMCLAYWSIGGSLYQNAALKADIISTLDWLNTNVYNSTTKSYGNWFGWDIGIPLNLNNLTILLYDSLTPAQIANYMNAVNHFTPSPTSVATSGANCAWCSSIVGLRGVIVKDATKIAAASAQFSALTAYVTSPDGFYTDGSYIGHGALSYNGGYGLYMLQQLADGYYLFNPTALSPLPASKRAIVYGWVLNSYQALMYQGKIPYYSIGREISRGPSDGRGESISATAAEIATGDTSAPAGQVLAFAKNVFAASGSNYSGVGGIGAVIRMKSLMSNPAITAAVDPVGTRIFSVMDKATSVQNGWSTSLAYYSPRTRNYESINGENLKGWHQADGMTYLDNADWNQYNGNFWATVNPQRLPGTTVTAGAAPAQGLANGSTFGGGADLGGLYGAVGFTLQPGNGQTLVANKAWFIFDDEEVCLGSGVTSTDGIKVETIIENRKLDALGDNLLTVGGVAQPTAKPWSATQNGVPWMHLAGSVPGADIGYYFPGGANLDFTRETRTSSWSVIGTGSTASVSDSYLTVGDSHGTSPSGAGYAYVLLPNYTAAQVAAYAVSPVATVLENDANVSAVRDARLGASGMVFWHDGSYPVGIGATPNYVSSDRKAVVMVQDAGNEQLLVSVSDPTQSNTAGINVEVGRPVTSIVSTDPGVTVSQLLPTLKMNVATSGALGRTFHAVFGTADAATTSTQIPIAAVFASGDDGDVPSNTLDNNYSTRWSAQGDGQWIEYDFPAAYQVSSVAIAFYAGTARTMPFDVQTSLDGTTWTTALSAASNGATNALQPFALPAECWGSHVRIIGHGNSQGTGWNSLTEVRFSGSATVGSYTDYAALNFTAAQLASPAITGALACPTGDGMANLLKYSQGLAPLSNASAGGVPTVQNVNGYLTLTYVRMKNATDLIYTPQVSSDLSNWRSGPAYTTQIAATDLDATRQQVVVRGNAPVASGGAGFMRLTVTQSANGASSSGSAASKAKAVLTPAGARTKPAVSTAR